MVLLVTGSLISIVAFTEIGSTIEEPDWIAVIEHFPDFTNIKVIPLTMQVLRVVDSKVTAPPLEVVADSAILFLESISSIGSEKEIVCGVLRISKDRIYFSEAKSVSEGSVLYSRTQLPPEKIVTPLLVGKHILGVIAIGMTIDP